MRRQGDGTALANAPIGSTALQRALQRGNEEEKGTVGSNLYISTSGAVARLQQLDTVANNLANAESTGFRADRAIFEAALAAQVPQEPGKRTPGVAGGVYVGVGGTDFDRSQGPIRRTGAPLDVALDGDGFFVVETPDGGEQYTRAGSFALGPDKRLVTIDGQPVLGASGPIEVSGSGIHIQSNGDVTDGEGVVSGTLRIVEFEDPSVLSKLGNGLLQAAGGVEPEDVEDPALIEQSLEGSNVQPVVELAALLTLQRAFEASMQAMQSEDSATRKLIQEMSE